MFYSAALSKAAGRAYITLYFCLQDVLTFSALSVNHKVIAMACVGWDLKDHQVPLSVPQGGLSVAR